MRAVAWVGLVACVSQASCAARTPMDSAKLGQRVEELAQKEATLQKQLEELQNRLFLLEDKVDTSRVAMERSRSPVLPVVRLRPQPSEGEATDGSEHTRSTSFSSESDQLDEEDEGTGEPQGGRSVVARRSVIYDGAATHGGPRPMLRLHESSGDGSAQSGSLALAGPDPASVKEKLPVVPVPRRSSLVDSNDRSPNGVGSPTKRVAPQRRTPDVRPMQAYQSAMAKYQSGDYAAAAAAFRSFFENYAQHAYADNALYWLAECSYDLGNYNLALKLFRQVVEQYPSGNKAPDALLKMGYCYLRLKDNKNARTILGQVVEIYPHSQVARLASEAITKL